MNGVINDATAWFVSASIAGAMVLKAVERLFGA